jgi:lipoprotein-anchoring transpeptidase ErfK/SrfK
VALSVLLIGNLFANQVLAEDVSPQPLTRFDCDKARMAWDDTANVCGAASLAAEAAPEAQGAQTADTAAQPLTREDCAKADMAWDDNANVCGAASLAAEAAPEAQGAQTADTVAQPLTREDCAKAVMVWDDTGNVCGAASQETTAITSTVLISIDKADQKMTVSLDGVQQYEWPVSTGLRGYTTPSGTYIARSMNKIWYSRQWDNAPMPHAVFFTKDGHAIHGTLEVKRLGKPASHGCVRLSPENAATLFALVEKTGVKNTQVVLAGSTPGGEGKVANKTRAKSSRSRYENYYADSFPQRRKRGGPFRRLFGG